MSVSLILVVVFVLLFEGASWPIPERILAFLGGKVVSEPELRFPLFVQLLSLVVAALPGAYVVYRDIRYWRF